jgi:ribonuclease HI
LLISTKYIIFVKLIEINFDGACYNTGKGGVCGIGVIACIDGEEVESLATYLPKIGTVTDAEYGALREAVLLALQLSQTYKDAYFIFKGDSQIVVRQIKGIYQTNPTHTPIKNEIINYLSKLTMYSLHWIPRAQNGLADILSKRGRALWNTD